MGIPRWTWAPAFVASIAACSTSERATSDAAPDGASNSSHDAAPEDDAGPGEMQTDARVAEHDASDDGGQRSAYPDATSTGPDLSKCAGGKLEKASGADDYRPKSNEVISCKEFTNRAIYVAQGISNVTIENCRFVTDSDLFINVQGAHVTIQDSAFVGPAGTWIRNSYEGEYLIVRRNDFSGMANAVEFNVGHEVLEDNFIHDFGDVSDDQHADGLQTNGTSHAVIRNNTVLLNDVAGATGAISIFEGDDILVEHNKVGGGGYTIYPGGKDSSDIRFVDNCFSNVFYPDEAQTGYYGAWYPSNNPSDLVRTGNVWCDGPREGQALNDNP